MFKRFHVFCTLQAYLDIGGACVLRQKMAETKKGPVHLAELTYRGMRGFALVRMLPGCSGQLGDFISYEDITEEQTDALFDAVYSDLCMSSIGVGVCQTKALRMDFIANLILFIRMILIIYSGYVLVKLFYIREGVYIFRFIVAAVAVLVLSRFRNDIMEKV